MSFPASTSPGWEAGSCLSPLGRSPLHRGLTLPGSWGSPAAEAVSPSCCPRLPPIPWEPQGGPGGSQLTGPERGPPRLSHGWMPTGTEFNVCSTTKPYQQPLPVFAQALRPLGSQARLPPGQGMQCWLSVYWQRAARPEHILTPQPVSSNGGQRRHGGAPTASGTDQVSGLGGVWFPASRSSGRSWLCLPICMTQEADRKIEGLVSSFLGEL